MKKIISFLIASVMLFTALPLTASAEVIWGPKIGGWSTWYSDAVGSIEVEYAANGKGSLKFLNETPSGPNQFIIAQTMVNLKKGAKYIYSLKARSYKTSAAKVSFDYGRSVSLIPMGGTYEWTQFEFQYIHSGETGGVGFQIVLEDVSKGFWADEIEMYEVTNGRKSDNNLITTSTFGGGAGGGSSAINAAGGSELEKLAAKVKGSDSFTLEDSNKVLGAMKFMPVMPAKGLNQDKNMNDWVNYPKVVMPTLASQYQMYKDIKPTTSGHFKTAWDDENFYLAIEVEDTGPFVSFNNGSYWTGDSIQIAMGTPSVSYGYEIGFVHDAKTGESGIYASNIPEIRLMNLKLTTWQSGNKTFYKAIVPWAVMYDDRPDEVLFNILFNDHDGESRAYCVELSPGISEGKSNALFPNLRLMEEGDAVYGWIEGTRNTSTEVPTGYELFVANKGAARSVEIEIPLADIKKTISIPADSGVRESFSVSFLHDEITELTALIDGQPTMHRVSVSPSAQTARKALLEFRTNAKTLERLLKKTKKAGISTDYETLNYNIIVRFIDYFEEDIDANIIYRWGDTIRSMRNIYAETKGNLDAYLSGKKEPFAVPRYVNSSRDIVRSHLVATTNIDGRLERRPTFFIGWGPAWPPEAEVPTFPDFGWNAQQREIGMYQMVMGADGKMSWPQSETDGFMRNVLDLGYDNDVNIDILLSPHYFPEILLERHPEIRYDGAGWMKFLIDHPVVKQAVEEFLREFIKGVKDHPAIGSVCFTNEPIYNTSFSDEYFGPAYREYLKEVYGNDINALNETYGTSFEFFDEVKMPARLAENAHYYDWMRFNDQTFFDWMQWAVGILREEAPNLPYHTKMMMYIGGVDNDFRRNYLTHASDQELWAPFFDINGNDAWSYYTETNSYPLTKFAWYDLLTSISEKPVFNSEDHIIPDRSRLYVPEQAKHVFTDLWQGAVHGRAQSTIWAWYRHNETSDYSGLFLYRPDCVQAAGNANFDLNRLAYEVVALQDAKADVGLLYSTTARVYERSYMGVMQAAYNSISFAGEKVHFIVESQPERFKDFKVLVFPYSRNVKTSTLNAVADYVSSGGKVILLGEDSLSLDEHNKPHNSDVLAKIYAAAQIIPIEVDGLQMSNLESRELDEIIEAAVSEITKKSISIIDVETGEPIRGVEWSTAVYQGKTLVNLVNYDWNMPKTIKIFKDGEEISVVKELRRDEELKDVVLEPYDPLLLQID